MSTTEQTVRSALPFVRWTLGYFPTSFWRWVIKRNLSKSQLAAGVRHEAAVVEGVPCEWIIPDEYDAERVLLYLHGGGFIYGWTQAHRLMVGDLTRKLGMRALAVDYRLAPEYPFPAALDDCVTAYRWLLKQGIAPQHIAIAGDSAGGNLTLATLLRLRDDGDPLPAAAACLSPAGNLTERDEMFKGEHDALLHPRAAKYFRDVYIGSGDAKNPLISPSYADFRGLPPLLIHAGDEEFLRYDARDIEQAARAAGVEVQLEMYPRMWHVWQVNLAMPEAQQSLTAIAQFIKAHVGVLEKQA
ncbi:MAG: alpha/beta hydrolase [Anaerolineae bacterium]